DRLLLSVPARDHEEAPVLLRLVHVSPGGRTIMTMRPDRRGFLKSAAASSALMGLGDLAFLSRLRPVSAEEARLDPRTVQLHSDIEPLVRLLEETPRDHLLEEVADRIHRGSSYREVLAALLLAGV